MEKLRNFLNVMVYDGSQLTDQLIKERYEASIHPDLIANPVISPAARPFRAGAAVEGFCEDQKPDLADLGTRRSHRHARQCVADAQSASRCKAACVRQVRALGAMGKGPGVQSPRHPFFVRE